MKPLQFTDRCSGNFHNFNFPMVFNVSKWRLSGGDLNRRQFINVSCALYGAVCMGRTNDACWG